jgi:hypothetical protein
MRSDQQSLQDILERIELTEEFTQTGKTKYTTHLHKLSSRLIPQIT